MGSGLQVNTTAAFGLFTEIDLKKKNNNTILILEIISEHNKMSF